MIGARVLLDTHVTVVQLTGIVGIEGRSVMLADSTDIIHSFSGDRVRSWATTRSNVLFHFIHSNGVDACHRREKFTHSVEIGNFVTLNFVTELFIHLLLNFVRLSISARSHSWLS